MWQQVELALNQSAHRVLFKLASFLPGLLALILAVVVLTAIGVGASALLRRILIGARFDERFSRDGSANVSDWAPSHSPTLLAGRIAFWTCVLLGCVIGISAFDASSSSTSQMSLFLIPYMTRAVGAILILFFGNLIARFLARSVLIGAVNQNLQYARFLSLGVKWLVVVLTTAMALDHLQLGGRIVDLAFGILFGGIVLTLALAVGLGSREIVSRSLEKTVDRPDPTPIDTVASQGRPAETLRHF